MSGPPKTPTRILKLHGSRRAEARKNEPKSTIYRKLPSIPARLKGDAAEFYRRTGGILIKMQLLSEVDFEAFVIMCEEFGQYTAAAKLCKKLVIKTVTGNKVRNPAIGVRDKAKTALKKSMAYFGMTPSARGNLSVKATEDSDPFAALSKPGRKRTGA